MLESIPSRIRAALGACLIALPLMASGRTHAACLEVQSPSVDFGGVWVGQEGHGNLLVRNTCERALKISKIAVSKPVFRAITPTPMSLPGLTSAWLEFGLTPQSRGPISGSACVYSNSGSRPACVSLAGNGVIPPTMTVSPTSLQVTQAAGTKGAVSLQIANSGEDHLEAIVDFTGPALPRPAAGWKVAFVQTATPAGYGQFIDMVRSLPNVDTLDVYDGHTGVPTLAYLNGFDVVLVEAGFDNWADPEATGDTLGAFILSGGKLAYFAQAFGPYSWDLNGLIRDFLPIKGYQTAFPGQSGVLADHPINAGVTTFRASSAMALDRIPDNASVSLGNYADYGYITGAVHVLFPIALLNFHPADQNWSGDVPRLVGNALDYLGSQAAWISTNGVYPYPGIEVFTANGGATRALDLNVLTYRMAPGTYHGEIRLLHDDPNQATPYVVPVTLTVTP
jgi:hypothetical protein